MHEKLGTFVFHLHKFSNIEFSAPILKLLENTLQLDFQLGTTMFTVTLLIFVIDTIVVYSMMMSDIEERTYEFAMLRCLGFQTKSLITLITIQSLLYAIPATAAGFALL